MNWLAIGGWLKKHWMWVLLPVGVLITLSKLFRPKVVIASPELSGHAQLEAKINDRVRAEQAVLTEKHTEQNKTLQEEYDSKVAAAQKQATDAVESLRNDPISLNDYLKKTGSNVRSGKH